MSTVAIVVLEAEATQTEDQVLGVAVVEGVTAAVALESAEEFDGVIGLLLDLLLDGVSLLASELLKVAAALSKLLRSLELVDSQLLGKLELSGSALLLEFTAAQSQLFEDLSASLVGGELEITLVVRCLALQQGLGLEVLKSSILGSQEDTGIIAVDEAAGLTSDTLGLENGGEVSLVESVSQTGISTDDGGLDGSIGFTDDLGKNASRLSDVFVAIVVDFAEVDGVVLGHVTEGVLDVVSGLSDVLVAQVVDLAEINSGVFG